MTERTCLKKILCIPTDLRAFVLEFHAPEAIPKKNSHTFGIRKEEIVNL